MSTHLGLPGQGPRRGGRWGFTVFVLLLIAAVLVIGGTWFFLPERYRASALVFVESPHPKPPLRFGEPIVSKEVMDRFVAEQAALITTDEVLRPAIKDAAIRDTVWFHKQKRGDAALAELKDRLCAEPVPDTSYVKVSFLTEKPQDAAAIVNTVIEKYIAHVEMTARQDYGSELEDYRDTLDDIDASLKRIRAEKERFMTENLGVAGLTEGINVIGETYLALAAEVARQEAEKLQHKVAYENLVAISGEPVVDCSEMRFKIEHSPRMKDLKRRQLDLELELAGLPSSRTTTQPSEADRRRAALMRKLDFIEKELEATFARLEDEVMQCRIDTAKTHYLNATQAELQLRERMMEAEAKQRDLDRGLARYRTLEKEEALLEERYYQVRNYMDKLRMIVNQRGMVRVRRAGQATPPEREDYRLQWIITGAALATPFAYLALYGLARLVFRPRSRSPLGI